MYIGRRVGDPPKDEAEQRSTQLNIFLRASRRAPQDLGDRERPIQGRQQRVKRLHRPLRDHHVRRQQPGLHLLQLEKHCRRRLGPETHRQRRGLRPVRRHQQPALLRRQASHHQRPARLMGGHLHRHLRPAGLLLPLPEHRLPRQQPGVRLHLLRHRVGRRRGQGS